MNSPVVYHLSTFDSSLNGTIDIQTLFTQLCIQKEVAKSGCLLKVNIGYATVLTYSGISYA